MSEKKIWLQVSNGQITLASKGNYFHDHQPQNAAVFLPVAQLNNRQYWLAIAPYQGVEPKPFASAQKTVPLREILNTLDEQLLAILSRASQLEHWWQMHQFCGSCGQKQQLHPVELALECTACQQLVFPRISPCMIVLVTRGRQMLLAKHTRSRSNSYSCLAGFVEVGESVEQTIVREVQEEVGLKVKNLQYQTSQNWPFPSQLMLGFWAEYESGDIAVDGVEIEDAAWFDCQNLPEIPAKGSISRALIDQFVQMHLI